MKLGNDIIDSKLFSQMYMTNYKQVNNHVSYQIWKQVGNGVVNRPYLEIYVPVMNTMEQANNK